MQKFFNIAVSSASELMRQPVYLILLVGSLAFMVLALRIQSLHSEKASIR